MTILLLTANELQRSDIDSNIRGIRGNKEEPITDRDALIHNKLITRFPYTLDLPPEAAGSVLSITAYWQNRDLMGRPSGIESVVIA
ncbi:MAG: hypothetical protein LBP80_06335 [Treponema sp.]|jgi:hypothetical protein|nr:hypothetical protein [Treponema sp.]